MKCYYIITYDFSSDGIEDVYNELQPKVSEYLTGILQDQIMHNMWLKKWDEPTRKNFITNTKYSLYNLLGKDIYNNNFSICVIQVTGCWCHPTILENMFYSKSLF